MSNLEIVCLAVCAAHMFFDLLKSFIMGKRITNLCNKCGKLVAEGEEHKCDDVLNSSQLEKLSQFIASLRGDNNG